MEFKVIKKNKCVRFENWQDFLEERVEFPKKSKNILVKKDLLKKQINKFYAPYFFNRKKNLPYVTGKIAISKNNLIYSKDTKRISDIHTDKFTHFLRYKNDSLIISSKTLNKDDPKLN